MVCCDRNSLAFFQREMERILEADFLKDGLQFMVPIFTLPQDLQSEINFCGGLQNEVLFHMAFIIEKSASFFKDLKELTKVLTK